MSRRLVVVLIGLAVVAVAASATLVGRALWERTHRTALEQALAATVPTAKRLAFTDWAAVRARLGVADDGSSDPGSVASWLERAYQQDLSAASSIDESGAALQREYGFSPANAAWEAYAQSDQGAAMVLRLDDAVDLDEVADGLERLGYTRPADPDGVWAGGADLVAGLDPTLSPQLQFLVVLPERHLVVSSDTAAYAATAAETAAGDGSALADTSSVRDLVAPLAEPAAAIVWAGDFACADLAMSHADEADRARAAELIAAAGKVSPLSGLAMVLAADRTLTVAEQFESADQARANLRARARLAVGEAVGRGGSSFADDLRLTGSRTRDATVLLTLRPRSSGVFPLSSLYDGPVLFATC